MEQEGWNNSGDDETENGPSAPVAPSDDDQPAVEVSAIKTAAHEKENADKPNSPKRKPARPSIKGQDQPAAARTNHPFRNLKSRA